MTNIVGGNTSNLAQLGSSQDGSTPNPSGADGSLDFLSLISFVYEGDKNLEGEVGILGNSEKSVNTTEDSMPLDQTQVEQIFSNIGKQVQRCDKELY